MYDFCAVMYFISRGIYGLQVKNNHKRKNMKNTLITLIAVTAGVATAGTDLTYWAENTGGDLLKIDTQYNSMPYLGNAAANARVGPDVIDVLTSVGSKTYTLHFKDSADAVHFAVNDALYFDQIYSTGTIKKYTIDFGAEGALTAATKSDVNWGGAIQFSQNAEVVFNVAVSAEQLRGVDGGEIFHRTIIASTDTKANGLWNVVDNFTLMAVGLEGYNNVGLIESVDKLEAGQYGWLKGVSGDENSGSCDSVIFAFRAVPEPTTATLSLLALVGLAARRRRK